ncbi:MAG: FeS assembly SUF system protein [Nanohaloarchaea archaeon SW_7_43_1]|nr:MAG: FeS assembly SUF system protein [Nanohaloarchaea archaeon SW_7_43_1]
MVKEKEVREQLKQVIDPELDVNIVDLGLIYEIEVDEQEDIDILMTLTTPGCPLHGVFDELVKKEVRKLDAGDIEVELTFEPRWTPEEMSDEAKDKLGNVPGMNVF